jgi:dienelactone hydrolase
MQPSASLRHQLAIASLIVLVVLVACGVARGATFDPAYEARQYQKINERAKSDYTPAFNAQLALVGAQNEAQGAQILANDGPGQTYGRNPTGNLCFHHMNGCAGDIRLYSWGADGDGIVMPVLFTQRNGSTVSGHVWMTRAGPARRPGIVFTNGSIQAPEQIYWFAAEALAKDGYIVLTWDPQGQGYSDTYGEGGDRMDGVPSQSGTPFFEGTEDALDFFFSSPQHPYEPRPSCSSGTSHTDKQDARVRAGLDSAYNPLWSSLDTSHIGLAGHSLGASAVSYVGQLDPRVGAIVAYDDMLDVTKPSGLTNYGSTISCPSGSSKWPIPLTPRKPDLGMTDDYGLAPQPFTSLPDPATKLGPSQSLSKAGIDTGELVIRGGTHYEYSYIPNPAFGATHRGMDMATWYLLAWFDKYLKNDPSATGRLQTNRWCGDAAEKAVDDQSPPDGNMFSVYYRSRLQIGGFDAEDMRAACSSGQLTADSWPANFSFLAYDLTKDSAPTPGSTTAAGGSAGAPPAANGRQPRCPIASGRLHGRWLGSVRLGMTRGHIRRAFPRFSSRGRRYMDFLCLAYGGIRVGYASPRLRARLSRHEGHQIAGRVVLALTANAYYALRGVHPGERLASVARILHPGRGYHVGRNWWYVVAYGRSHGLLKVRHGRIEEIGIVDRRLTARRRATMRFLTSFS